MKPALKQARTSTTATTSTRPATPSNSSGPVVRQGVNRSRLGRRFTIAVPYLWLLLFFFVPFLLVVKISFADQEMGVPPYTQLLDFADGVVHLTLQLGHYAFLVQDSLYFETYVSSLKIAALSTLGCLLIGYPLAYQIARSNPARRNLYLMAVMLPFWTSFLIRVYAWIGILKNNGLLNQVLMALGLVHTPVELYHTTTAVYIGMIYSYLPFLVMPLYAHLIKMDPALLEAAHDLGATPWRAFVQVTLPLSKNGIIAGCLLVFIPSVGEYVIPGLLGGADTLMIGRVMWDEFFSNADWPMASAVTCAMVLLLLVPIALFQYFQGRERSASRASSGSGRITSDLDGLGNGNGNGNGSGGGSGASPNAGARAWEMPR